MASSIVRRKEDVPKAPLYVVMIDKFMSDWGQSKGKNNVVIFPCMNDKEADHVAAFAEKRSEMRRIRVQSYLPSFTKSNTYSVLTVDTAPRWYGYETAPAEGASRVV